MSIYIALVPTSQYSGKTNPNPNPNIKTLVSIIIYNFQKNGGSKREVLGLESAFLFSGFAETQTDEKIKKAKAPILDSRFIEKETKIS